MRIDHGWSAGRMGPARPAKKRFTSRRFPPSTTRSSAKRMETLMLKFLSLFARPAQDRADIAREPLRFHAPLYCAARNVYMTAETVFTALDADRLFRALSEMHVLGTALGSPVHDMTDITRWRDAVGARVRQLREPQHASERRPDGETLEVFISKGVAAVEKQRRASA